MEQTRVSERSIQRAKVSWEQAQEDLKTAQSYIKTHPDRSSLQSTQAAMNALSAVLDAQGHFQLPAYSTNELLSYCVKIDPLFESLRSPCHVLDSTLERDFFGKPRSPSVPFTPAFAKACYRAAKTVLEGVQAYRKQHPSSVA